MPQYTKFEMAQALEAVAAGESIRKAARAWGIRTMTLYCRLNGTQSHQVTAEGQQRLSPVQEKRLAN
jgi:hypothetical protein